jgi:hypothetical protein
LYKQRNTGKHTVAFTLSGLVVVTFTLYGESRKPFQSRHNNYSMNTDETPKDLPDCKPVEQQQSEPPKPEEEDDMLGKIITGISDGVGYVAEKGSDGLGYVADKANNAIGKATGE